MLLHALAQLIFGFFVVGMFVIWLIGVLCIFESVRSYLADRKMFKNIRDFK